MIGSFFGHLSTDAASALNHSLVSAQPLLDSYGYLAVFGVVLVEGFGIPAPGQTLLIAASILSARGKMSFVLVLALAFLAGVMGGTIGYVLGRWGGSRLLRKAGLSQTRLSKMERLFSRYGGGVVLMGRFLDGLRQVNAIGAGSLQMPFWKFTLFNTLGTLAWIAVWGLGVYFVGKDMV